MSARGLVVVFGGSGFVGKRTVRALVKEGWRVRVVTRSPHTEGDLRVIGSVGQVQLAQNIRSRDQSAQGLLALPFGARVIALRAAIRANG